jgi:hypothetical protein
MKKLSLAFLILLGSHAFAQQKGIGYQAVIINPKEIAAPGYNAVGTPLANKSVCMSFQILNATNQVEYQETQTLSTDQFGMVNLTIGNGTKNGGTAASLATVTWGLGIKTLVVGVNTNGTCINYTEISRQVLNYVPYALYAEEANLKDGVITTSKLADGSVTDAKVAAGINKSKVGLTNVDNTSDVLKPISTETQTALNLKANTSDLTNGLANKVDKVSGKDLSTNDYTTAEKTKLAAITGTNTGDQDLSALATVTSVALKANDADVNNALSLKANANDVTSGLATKVDKVTGKDLSTNDYTTAEKNKLASLSGTLDLSLYATLVNLNTKVDKVTGKELSTNDYTTVEKTKLAAITGTNTGDQDLSPLATAANLTSGLATKVDKVTGKELSTNDYTTAEKTKLAAITGTNTGDQDLSALATAADLTSSLVTKVDKTNGKDLSTNDYTTAEKTKLAAITGTNTGDQDLSALATVDLLASKASLTSPTFTGTPFAPTAAVGTNNTQIATTAYVDAAVTAGAAFTGTAPISVLAGAISLNDNGVTTLKIADNAITTVKIQDLSITTADIANSAVTIAKLPAGATATNFLRGDGTWALPSINTASTSVLLNGLSFERAAFTGDVTATQNSNALTIANSVVISAKIADGAVTSTKIADLAVTVAKIADLAVTGTKIANGTISNTNLTTVNSKTFKGRTDAGTGVVQDLTVAQVKTDLAIDLVNNTSDASKPVSTATQTALDLKANLSSPALTDFPTAPTQTAGDNSTKLATTAYVDEANRTIFSTRISLLSDAAPAPVGSSLFNYYTLTAQAVPATFNAPSGTPFDGNSLVLKIKASSAEIAVAWNTIYRDGTDISLPTITNKTMVLHFMYNAADTKWDLVGITNGI